MKKFLLHMYVAFCLYRIGYFFSKNTHGKEEWGFYRINFSRGEETTYAIVDVDFDPGYTHMHGVPHRWNK